MFKKIIVGIIIVSFLFCFKSISSLGIDVPSTIKEDIYLLNYDKTIDTLYLIPNAVKNYYCVGFMNCSPNSYFCKIKSNITTFKSLTGKEIAKNTLSPVYPYCSFWAFCYIPQSKVNENQSLGYLVFEIFSLQGEKSKEISIGNLIITDGINNISLNKKEFHYENGTITNITSKTIPIFINTIKQNQIVFKQKILKPQEIFDVNLPNIERSEIILFICSNNHSELRSNFLILNKEVQQYFKGDQPQKTLYWCQDKNQKMYGFLAHENVFSIFCYSEQSTEANIVAKIKDINQLSKIYSLKKGWNKINLVFKNSIIESEIELIINKDKYLVEKIYVANQRNKISIDFKIIKNKLIYPNEVQKETVFMVLTKHGIIYCELLLPGEPHHIPTYHLKNKIITINNCNYKEIIIVNLSTDLEMIKPTLSE